MAKADRIILPPLPEAPPRGNALLNGRVNLIEPPPADSVAQLHKSGFKRVTSVTPHV